MPCVDYYTGEYCTYFMALFIVVRLIEVSAKFDRKQETGMHSNALHPVERRSRFVI